ncbi:MAG: hypothetical protein E7372_05085 [Clostridiales bacterium]|nr:hypothetical protein [Clostridiales bacterium]
MEEKDNIYICDFINKKLQKKISMLKDDSCFGSHGVLSVLLKNVKFYFDVKPKNPKLADAILQVILCNIKHLIELCSLNNESLSMSKLLNHEKNTWQYYSDIIAPKKTKQLYLEVALNEYLIIENYKKLRKNYQNSQNAMFEKLITESKECLLDLHKIAQSS